jgi:hypothetical protein
MKIDEVVREVFQHEIDHQTFREAKPEEIAQALYATKSIHKKKARFAMMIAAAVFACLVFAVLLSLPFHKISMQPGILQSWVLQPLAKTITEKLPENPEEHVVSFVQLARSGVHSHN